MARERSPQRTAAKTAFLESGGKITTKTLAKKIGVSEPQIRKWKSLDKWQESIPKKRGAPKGNKNAKGNGAPGRNSNAVKHGAYTTVHLDELSKDDRKYIEGITSGDTQSKLVVELQLLYAKEKDLKQKIKLYDTSDGELLYTEKRVITQPGDSAEEKDQTITTIEGSAFSRQMKVENELERIHGRIIKILDSIKAYELEVRRIELDEKRYCFNKQRVSGTFNYDPENGEIDDNFDE